METTERKPSFPAVVVEEEEDDDTPVLSGRALEALREFLSEQQQLQQEEEEDETRVKLVMEDWRMSQFWYEKDTAETVAEEIVRICNGGEGSSFSSVACIACPTLYAYLKEINATRLRLQKMCPNISVQLLEYDRRFEQYGNDFTFYDYNQPVELSSDLKHAFKVVVADPPYLSQECLEKVSETISFLALPQESYLMLLTGDVQKDRAAELLNLNPCGFRPKHSSKLGNEFRLFTSYDPEKRLGGWELVG